MPDPAYWSDVVGVLSVLQGQKRTAPLDDWCGWVAEKDALDKLMRNI